MLMELVSLQYKIQRKILQVQEKLTNIPHKQRWKYFKQHISEHKKENHYQVGIILGMLVGFHNRKFDTPY